VTAEIVNLRQRRKDAAREDKEKRAAANREKFGQTKSEKAARQLKASLDNSKLDAHRRDTE
jgi:Domain of unknown function (DUF4169)